MDCALKRKILGQSLFHSACGLTLRERFLLQQNTGPRHTAEATLKQIKQSECWNGQNKANFSQTKMLWKELKLVPEEANSAWRIWSTFTCGTGKYSSG